MKHFRLAKAWFALLTPWILPSGFLVVAGCATIRHTTDLIKANEQGVEASTASIRLNQDAVSDSTDAIDHNQKAIMASTAAIADNSRAVQQSTNAIVQKQKLLSGVTSQMQTLSPDKPQFKWIAATVIAAIVAMYGAVIALLISSIRIGSSLRTGARGREHGPSHHTRR